jgi:hypothetical protein
LIALAFLLPLDVAFRRIQIDRHSIASLFGFGHSKGDSTATMGTLLARKKTIEKALAAQRLSSPIISVPESERTATRGPTSGASGDRPPPKPAPDKPTEAANSTTSRLLDMKRKRQQEGNP